MPKISFVVPLYNKQAYIVDCMESLVSQSMKDIEIVVVDDCSTDASYDLVEMFAKKDKRIKLYKLKTNKGRSYARNYGNSKAKSKIICVQDADDISSKQRAEVVYGEFKKDSKASVFYSGFYISDSIGRVHQEIRAVELSVERIKTDKVMYICHSTMAYKKKDVPQYTGGKVSDLGIDDWKLQLDCYKKGLKFIYLDKPLVVYRNTPNAIVSTRDALNVVALKDKLLRGL